MKVFLIVKVRQVEDFRTTQIVSGSLSCLHNIVKKNCSYSIKLAQLIYPLMCNKEVASDTDIEQILITCTLMLA